MKGKSVDKLPRDGGQKAILLVMGSYASRVRSCLAPRERAVFEKLRSPRLIQDFLDTVPINFELDGDTYLSPRRVLELQKAHCAEGAVFAAAALAYQGARPLLMDFKTVPNDEDHVVALYQKNGYWGAISKTNHAILRWRDPVYRSVRELAMSYFNEYLLWNGNKSLRSVSYPFDLSRFAPERWVAAVEDLDWLMEALDESRHFDVVPKVNGRALRRGARVEIDAMRVVEWPEPPGFKPGG